MPVRLRGITYGVQGEPNAVDTAQALVLENTPNTEIVVVERGQRGAPGPKGEIGPQGPPGGAGYRHFQNIPAPCWVVQHNLGRRPGGIRVTDVDGMDTDAMVTHMSDDVLLLTFYDATAGTADIS